MRYTGQLVLPLKLPVRAEVLGTTLAVELAGYDLVLAWPLPDDRAKKNEYSMLVAPAGFVEPEGSALERAQGRLSWGTWRSAELCYVAAAAVSFEVLGPGSSVGLWREFEECFAIAWDWIAVWSGCSWRTAEELSPRIWARSESQPDYTVTVNRGIVGGTSPGGGGISWLKKPGIRALGLSLLPAETGVTHAQLHQAFGRALRSERLPSAHRLLLSARHGLREGDHRRAAIDAATAAEVALGAAVTSALEAIGAPSEFIDRALLGANGLTGLVDMARSLGIDPVVSKARAADRIALVRNRAAHGGHSPDAEAASVAVHTATTIVESVAPFRRCSVRPERSHLALTRRQPPT